MLSIVFAVAIGVTLGIILTSVIAMSLMTNEAVIKWYIKKTTKVATAMLKASDELMNELD